MWKTIWEFVIDEQDVKDNDEKTLVIVMIFIGLAPDITGILPKTVILTNNFLRQRYISITEDFSKSFFGRVTLQIQAEFQKF